MEHTDAPLVMKTKIKCTQSLNNKQSYGKLVNDALWDSLLEIICCVDAINFKVMPACC